MNRYAVNTSVSVDKSKAEIERILTRYGADDFFYGSKKKGNTAAIIAFSLAGKHVKFALPLPNPDDFALTPSRRKRRHVDDMLKAYEQACRQSWRALCLVIKAKLEAVESGITTFEQEFLAHILLPNNQTVGEHILPMVDQAYLDGKMPPLMLTLEEKK